MLQGTQERLAGRQSAFIVVLSSKVGRRLVRGPAHNYFRLMRSETERYRRRISGWGAGRIRHSASGPLVQPIGPEGAARRGALCRAKRWVFSCEVAYFPLVGACVLRLSGYLNFTDFVRWG
jgi:hypothetical protein